MMEAIHPSETLVLTKATWCIIPEDGILHSYHRENLRSYILGISFEIFEAVICLRTSAEYK
jgi:hypothetical protein